ncbi:Crp/Fnr family transcriptional regulator [Entomospira culicis]|uniref:Crp/Fnr family transcriptional regulator n=1 Tax=Entomospira culicis TaxID=2719989 RepID=A0A968GER2_9SPIO|nr:Crp/Fnr family transcriptional regulator [Entomospira culicis]NIZ18938.1 Crp/Fnr family transcriptional regulator [Entomospira culicis]NIZ69153.1 Crp/Fnr family transcriptional regulator [Entomospira culicis]WDI37740.1 Crp/Fnr family transcriptional regulator [Entomospira culicis]WDI39368.1 Crp/Fnr family transcriptional regulator [Entomospira culicis]
MLFSLEIIQILKQNIVFNQFNSEELGEIFSLLNVKQKKYAKDQIILQQGDPLNYIGILISGKLMLYHTICEETPRLLNVIHPAQMLGEAFVITGKHISQVTIKSQQKSNILWMNYHPTNSTTSPIQKDLIARYHQYLTKSLAEKIIFLQKKLYVLAQPTLKMSMITLLQFYYCGEDWITLPFKTHEELADYLSVNRSFLSRLLNAMERDNIFNREKNKYKLNTKFLM